MSRRTLLFVDAAINLALGVLLLVFPRDVVEALGVPDAETAFYPGVLGGVLFGIGIALIVEARRREEGPVGLGRAGAVAINLCGAAALGGWLLFGGLELPLRGRLFLGGLALLLVALSILEWRAARIRPPG